MANPGLAVSTMKRQRAYFYWGLKDVNPEISKKVLDRLNSIGSPEEIVRTVTIYAGYRVLSVRVAQRIFHARMGLGKFEDLQQIATVPGIGPKKFTLIVDAFSNSD